MLNLQTQTTIPNPLVGYAILYWATTFEWRVKKNIAGVITDESLLAVLSDYYTSAEIDTILTDYYTSAEVDTILTGYYTQVEVDDLLDLKEDVGVAAALIAALTKADVGLDQVDNTSDVNKPISTATQDAFDLKQDLISASNLQFLYQNAGGVIEGIPDYYINSFKGMQLFLEANPNDLTGASIHNFNMNIAPLQDSPDEGYTFLNLNVNSDSALFSYGTNGRAITINNLNFSHTSDKDLGEVNFLNNYFNLGNGTDAINVRGFSYSYGFGNINANVNIVGAMQGYGFQPSFNSSATVDATTYGNAFYDGLNALGVAFPSYTSYSANPQIGSINNNSNYTGMIINPSITNFTGNAGANAIAIAGNYGTFGSGGFQGININPTVTSGNYVAGINVNMSNATGTNVKAIDAIGDVSIDGSLSFTGALSIGQLNAFYQSNPVDGGGNPQGLHGLVSGMVALNGVTTNNCDAIGVNTAMLITLEENSVNNSGAFGLGFTSIALPCVVETHTGSYLQDMSGATFAINLAGTSTGGTIDTVKLARCVAIPNGITTINNLRGFEFDSPFGLVGTTIHGFYTALDVNNYFAGNLVIGELTEVATNASVGLEISSVLKAFLNARMTTTQRDALTAVNGMQIYNSTTDKLQIYAAGSWIDLH